MGTHGNHVTAMATAALGSLTAAAFLARSLRCAVLPAPSSPVTRSLLVPHFPQWQRFPLVSGRWVPSPRPSVFKMGSPYQLEASQGLSPPPLTSSSPTTSAETDWVRDAGLYIRFFSHCFSSLSHALKSAQGHPPNNLSGIFLFSSFSLFTPMSISPLTPPKITFAPLNYSESHS